MEWYKIVLRADDETSDKAEQIQDEFEQLFLVAREPKDAAMFCGGFNRKNEYTLYFSPGAVRIAQTLMTTLSGVPCNLPPKDVSLLVGHPSSQKELIGE